MKSVYIVGGGYSYAHLFEELGYHVCKLLSDSSLVCFTGGEDVTPSIYGDEAHDYTQANVFRDEEEAKIAQYCVIAGIPMVGICRGAQFLNVMAGGRMYQHVEGHGGNHKITDVETGLEVLVSSTHHQMMMPSPSGLLVATASLHGSREWFDGQKAMKDVSDADIEVVYYDHIKALCFQPHPEFIGYPDMRQYFKSLVTKYLENQYE